MPLALVYLPEAGAQFAAIEAYIAEQGNPTAARRYVDKIIRRCELIVALPLGGRVRADLAPGLRSVSFKGRVTIVYRVNDQMVVIAGVFYGSQHIARQIAALRR